VPKQKVDDLYQPAETLTHRRHRLRRARQYPVGPRYVFALDVPVGRRQDESGSARFGIADLRRALAGFRPGLERLAGSGGAMATEVKRTTEPRRHLLVERDENDADAAAHAEAAVLAVQSASASVDDALAELEQQLADAQLRLDPERDQAARAAEAMKREKDALELKQAADDFVDAGARLAESLKQVTAVSFTATEATATVLKAVSETVEATKRINRELENYVRLVGSSSTPLRRQPMPVTSVEMSASKSATLALPSPFPEVPSRPLVPGAAA
jgi:hypothetical protein